MQEKEIKERLHWFLTWRAWATHFNVPGKIVRVLCGYFEHERRVQFEGCVAEPLQTITAISWVKVELLAPAHCVAGRSE